MSVMSKILERCLCDPSMKTFDKILFRHQMGHRKACKTQHSLVAMFENWKKNLDKGRKLEILYANLSKTFYCLQHHLLLAKLNAYGFV